MRALGDDGNDGCGGCGTFVLVLFWLVVASVRADAGVVVAFVLLLLLLLLVILLEFIAGFKSDDDWSSLFIKFGFDLLGWIFELFTVKLLLEEVT